MTPLPNKKKRQHFVPQHYLRQFRLEATKQIAAAKIQPYRFIGPAAIRQQCQEDYFYGEDGVVEELMCTSETELAPVVIRVTQNERFNAKEQVALCWLAVTLRERTRKAERGAKLLPKRLAYEFVSSAIRSGRLRPPTSGGFTEDMVDFTGVSEHLIRNNAIPCWLEMQTLGCKLLKAAPGTAFITSDHPVTMLNQCFAAAKSLRSYVGFSCSGFQLLLPLAPHLALFFYDPKIYKVGPRRAQLLTISEKDVEIVNSLQIQAAEECVYFHDLKLESEVCRLADRYANLRVDVEKQLRSFQGRNSKEELLIVRNDSVQLPNPWAFCTYRRHVVVGPHHRRNAAWSTMIDELIDDVRRNPLGGGTFDRIEKILGCSVRNDTRQTTS